MTPQDDYIVDRIAIAMKRRRLSQRQVAYLAGIDHAAISRLFNRRTTPRWSTVRALIGALGGSIEVTIPGERQ